MSRHYFPSVLDDFEKQSPSEHSIVPSLDETEMINKVLKMDSKYYYYFIINYKNFDNLLSSSISIVI